MIEDPFLCSAMIISSMMTVIYILALIKRDYSIIDISWPFGFLLISIFILDWNAGINELLVKIFVTVWSVRLCLYLFYRIMRHGPDARYKELELDWGKSHRIHAFFKIYVLQGFLMYWIAMPVTTTVFISETKPLLIGIGSTLWVVGFLMETFADYQVYTFRQKPENRGKYLMTGFFSYSRHPNYLGESLLWIGIGILALPNLYPMLPLLGPSILITALYKFSGVPYAERNRKGKVFEEYAKNTGAIFPKIF